MSTFLPSPYFSAGRAETPITDIVVHWMDGTLAATDAEFTGGSRRVSAHYGIEDTTIHSYVHESDTAWHAGNWDENLRSIGIEHSAAPGRPASAATVSTSVLLIVGLARKYGISPDRIYPHNRFFPTACPGTLPVADIIARVRAGLGHPAPPPATPAPKPVPTPTGGLTVNTLDLSHVTTNPATWVHSHGVTPLQRLLQVKADGVGGPGTRAALVSWQSHAGVKPDAVFGPVSASAILAGR